MSELISRASIRADSKKGLSCTCSPSAGVQSIFQAKGMRIPVPADGWSCGNRNKKTLLLPSRNYFKDKELAGSYCAPISQAAAVKGGSQAEPAPLPLWGFFQTTGDSEDLPAGCSDGYRLHQANCILRISTKILNK